MKKKITHQLHQQTPELINKLSTPKKILTEVFGFTESQFMENGKLKIGEHINFNSKQKIKIQQLLQNQILQLAGFSDMDGIFFAQNKYGYLWTSISNLYIIFNKDTVCIGVSCNINYSFSAIYSKK